MKLDDQEDRTSLSHIHIRAMKLDDQGDIELLSAIFI
jgi:hypothetical protein